METENLKERKKLFEKTKDELLLKQMSNSETFDKSILSLSSAFLGLSMVFVKDVVQLNSATHTILLYASWVMLLATIIITISSFLYGQRANKRLVSAAKSFYLENDETAYKISEKYSKRVDYFNLASGSTFILGLLFIVIFIVINSIRIEDMSDNQKSQPINTFPKPSQPNQPTQNQQPSKINKTT